MASPQFRLIGSICLRTASASVASASDTSVKSTVASLHAALQAFRVKHGFGRAASAPQIGSNVRIIAMDLRACDASVSAGMPPHARTQPLTVYNPLLRLHPEDGTMTMMDDCMSAPDWVVRVRRHRVVGLEYDDDFGSRIVVPRCSTALSELLQHEVDHLDGITMFDRADGAGAVFHRSEYVRNRRNIDASVDYAIYSSAT